MKVKSNCVLDTNKVRSFFTSLDNPTNFDFQQLDFWVKNKKLNRLSKSVLEKLSEYLKIEVGHFETYPNMKKEGLISILEDVLYGNKYSVRSNYVVGLDFEMNKTEKMIYDYFQLTYPETFYNHHPVYHPIFELKYFKYFEETKDEIIRIQTLEFDEYDLNEFSNKTKEFHLYIISTHNVHNMGENPLVARNWPEELEIYFGNKKLKPPPPNKKLWKDELVSEVFLLDPIITFPSSSKVEIRINKKKEEVSTGVCIVYGAIVRPRMPDCDLEDFFEIQSEEVRLRRKTHNEYRKIGNQRELPGNVMKMDVSVSLLDPITLCRVETPVRSVKCEHAEVHDLKTFIKFSYEMKNLKCGHRYCFQNIDLDDIYIDERVQEVLRKTERPKEEMPVERVLIDPKKDFFQVIKEKMDVESDDEENENENVKDVEELEDPIYFTTPNTPKKKKKKKKKKMLDEEKEEEESSESESDSDDDEVEFDESKIGDEGFENLFLNVGRREIGKKRRTREKTPIWKSLLVQDILDDRIVEGKGTEFSPCRL